MAGAPASSPFLLEAAVIFSCRARPERLRFRLPPFFCSGSLGGRFCRAACCLEWSIAMTSSCGLGRLVLSLMCGEVMLTQ